MIVIANSLAMTYNMLVASINRFTRESVPPDSRSGFRSLLTTFILPLLIYVTFDMVRRSGLEWAQRRAVAIALSGLVIALSLIGLIPLVFPNAMGEGHSFLSGLRIPSILSLTFIMTFGLILYRRSGGPWAGIGALAMFVGMTAPAAIFGAVVGVFTETFFAFCLLLTERKLQLSNQ